MEYVNGKLTRTGAEAVIAAGGAVNIGGHIYTRVEQLPSEAAFAAGDAEREQAALRNIDAQIAGLTVQRGHLAGSAPAVADPSADADTAATSDLYAQIAELRAQLALVQPSAPPSSPKSTKGGKGTGEGTVPPGEGAGGGAEKGEDTNGQD